MTAFRSCHRTHVSAGSKMAAASAHTHRRTLYIGRNRFGAHICAQQRATRLAEDGVFKDGLGDRRATASVEKGRGRGGKRRGEFARKGIERRLDAPALAVCHPLPLLCRCERFHQRVVHALRRPAAGQGMSTCNTKRSHVGVGNGYDVCEILRTGVLTSNPVPEASYLSPNETSAPAAALSPLSITWQCKYVVSWNLITNGALCQKGFLRPR